MSDSRNRTWISAEISPELMENLERRSKACGISRSEGVRQALRQWSCSEGRESQSVEDRGRRIVALLDELREEILLELSDKGSETDIDVASLAKDTTAKANTGNSVEHLQMELYEGEGPTEYIDRAD